MKAYDRELSPTLSTVLTLIPKLVRMQVDESTEASRKYKFHKSVHHHNK